MTTLKLFPFYFCLFTLFLFSCQPKLIIKEPKYDYKGLDKRTIDLHKKIERFIYIGRTTKYPVPIDPRTRIDTLLIDDKTQHIRVDLSKHFSFIPFREENVHLIYYALKKELGRKYRKYTLTIRSLDQPIEQLIPNFYRPKREEYDANRMSKIGIQRPLPLVRRQKKWQAEKGLEGRNIALWNSHGWYYSNGAQRWEWQRPRLFQTVEDLLPMSIVLPYLMPMLENAGALVFNPRERDFQTNMIIVDNDGSNNISKYMEESKDKLNQWQTSAQSGFAIGAPPYQNGENPFLLGTGRQIKSDTVCSAQAQWIADFPDSGDYAVYVSWQASLENVSDAHYTVFHAGGQTNFLVNQQIGGGTWVFLGTFYFQRGQNAETGRVLLSNHSQTAGRIVSADAVRFGGGRSNVARGGDVSGRPRFMEAARYNLQYAGLPDSLVYDLNDGKNDYKDDYQGRPEYANYLYGAPFGPNKNRRVKGLGIPVDLSLAFHTDAGITHNDTVIGTLSIYSIADADTQVVFPDGVSRLANRDLADIMQTQLVDDIRATFDAQWNRRQLMESQYSEAYRPNMPSMLLELLSHQNFLDMQFIQDPRFRFMVGRSIYKSMLKFIATHNDLDFVVQPLPVTHFSAVFDSNGHARLSWRPQFDPLETSAAPTGYLVQRRKNIGGFDDGILAQQSKIIFDDLESGVIYSFKVSAVNAGGKSFPSETLALCRMENNPQPVLIVNGFDRICSAAVVETPNFSGFADFIDQGVPDKYDLNYSGGQIDFDPKSPFRLNDAPGHGASSADWETTIIPGNIFDFPYVHGQSIYAAGYSFVSCSDEVIADSSVSLSNYRIVDWILGEEKETPWQRPQLYSLRGKQFKTFDRNTQQQIRRFTENGGALFLSGAYPGSDLFKNKDAKHTDAEYGRSVLKFEWVTDHAAKTGKVISLKHNLIDLPRTLLFNQAYHPRFYTVEAPDAINPINGSSVVLRYAENLFSAGVAYKGAYRLVAFGFPFETITNKNQRDQVMRAILNFFK